MLSKEAKSGSGVPPSQGCFAYLNSISHCGSTQQIYMFLALQCFVRIRRDEKLSSKVIEHLCWCKTSGTVLLEDANFSRIMNHVNG